MARLSLDAADDANRKINESLESLKELQTTEEEMAQRRLTINIEEFRNSIPPMEECPFTGKKYREITWGKLYEVFGYEKPAHGFVVRGDVSALDKENWQYSKYLRLRDCEGKDVAISFGDVDFNEDVDLGWEFLIRSPRYHRFLDGNDGIRIESTLDFRHSKKALTDPLRLEYALLKKKHATGLYNKKLYESAAEAYESSIALVEAMKTPDREHIAACYLNIAQCNLSLQKYGATQFYCKKALMALPSSGLQVKAYYRMGVATRKGNDPIAAEGHLRAALAIEPDNVDVLRELSAVQVEAAERRASEKALFHGALKKAAVKTVVVEGPFKEYCEKEGGGFQGGLVYRGSLPPYCAASLEEQRNAMEVLKIRTHVTIHLWKPQKESSSSVTVLPDKCLDVHIDFYTPLLRALTPFWIQLVCWVLNLMRLYKIADRIQRNAVFRNVTSVKYTYLTLQHCGAEYARALSILCDADNTPVLLRCPSGNDISAVILQLARLMLAPNSSDDDDLNEPVQIKNTEGVVVKDSGSKKLWEPASSCVLPKSVIRKAILSVVGGGSNTNNQQQGSSAVESYFDRIGVPAGKRELIRKTLCKN
eukprot:PhF_6_TR31461/c0_g1_i1/m.46183